MDGPKKDPQPDPNPDATLIAPSGQFSTNVTTPVSKPTSPFPTKSASASGFEFSIPIQDLSSDKMLIGAPRMAFGSFTVPELGGIPLLSKLGQGGMGAVYFGVKPRLKTEVAVKILPLYLAESDPVMVDRFVREAQLAAKIESPHLIRVTDVDEVHGFFYIVMEYVRGLSARDIIKRAVDTGRQGLEEAVALDIIIAATEGLAAAHRAGIVHRDLKPDNILVPKAKGAEGLSFTAAKLADLGLARSEEAGQSLTGAHSGMGTPGYMAPEQARSAKSAGKPADVFGMGATLYSLLSGTPPFRGDTSTETILKTIQEPHLALRPMRKDLSLATEALIERCLSKEPAKRFVDGAALLDALRICRASLGTPDSAQQQAAQQVATMQKSEAGLKLETTPLPGTVTQIPQTVVGTPAPAAAPTPSTPQVATPRKFPAGILVGAAALVLIVAGLCVAVMRGGPASGSNGVQRQPDGASAAIVPPAASGVKLGIAYGSEKESWLKWAAQEFAKGDAGKSVDLELLSMGSQEGGDAIVNGDKRIAVWMPASSAYKDIFVKHWNEKNSNPPILKEEVLATTPMVFLVWKEKADALKAKYGAITFQSLSKAIQDSGGKFKFGHTDPSKSNSGLMTMLLMALETQKGEELSPQDVQNPAFQSWLAGIESATTTASSTGHLVREMMQGSSTFDAISVYENLAIENIKVAEDRGVGTLEVAYPPNNVLNDHPYYMIDAPWVGPQQRTAAEAFLRFLMSEAAQKKLLEYGFRPGDTHIPINFPESPFVMNRKSGIQIRIEKVGRFPGAETIIALMGAFENARKGGVAAIKPATSVTPTPVAQGKISFGIGYGTEKEAWLKWAAGEFAQTEAGKNISPELIPLGSQEGAEALLRGDARLQVWAPASSVFKETFAAAWKQKMKTEPIAREEFLAVTPMVFLCWKDRQEGFQQKLGTISFTTLRQAILEPSGWKSLGGKAEWGKLKFGHTDPTKSNSGLMTLILMAYESSGKTSGLTAADINSEKFQTMLADFKGDISAVHSTGTLMKDMVLKGNTKYDIVCTYESMAIDYLKIAEDRGLGELTVAYPPNNVVNDHPYYIVGPPASSEEQRKAAGAFVDFLLGDKAQKQVMTAYGFRPGNPQIAINFPESPFVTNTKAGIRLQTQNVCEFPKAEVIDALMKSWESVRK